MYEIEDFPEDALRGRKLNSVEFMRVGRFIDVFAEKIFNLPEGTFDPYGEIAAYNREHGIETSELNQEMPEGIDENDKVQIKGLKEDAEVILVASADYVPEQASEEEDDYTNGRLDIFRSYIEQLNMTGHETMGAILENDEVATHAHNIYLQVAYDHGIPVGIIFLLVGIATFVKACLYYVKKKDTISYAALPAIITVAVAVMGMVEWVFHISNPCGLALMLVITPFLFREG